jgi:hypothetical protein
LLFDFWQRSGRGGRDLAGLCLAGVVFAAMVTPLGLFSASHFGKTFFNYTKYWMWMDDFEAEAWPFQRTYPGGVQLKTLRPEDTPSPAWYLRRHTVAEAGARLAEGAGSVFARFFFPEPKLRWSAIFWRSNPKKWEQPLAHRGVYLITIAALAVGLAGWARGQWRETQRQPEVWWRTGLVVGVAGIYIALYGWYWPIGKGDRFMGSLWIPALVLVFWLAARGRQRSASRSADVAYLTVQGAVLISLLVQAVGMFVRFGQGVFLVTRN